MTVVAIAGGGGGMGRTLVDQIRLAGKHQVFILSRKESGGSQPNQQSASAHLKCDYDDIDSMVAILEANQIDTVISTINIGGEAARQSEVNLIKSADKSSITRRFIPSHFVVPFDDSDAGLQNMLGPWTLGARALKNTSLEYTYISNGVFMDYWGMPNIPTYLDRFSWGLDVPNKRAVIPGSGNDKFSTTYSKDIARFVAAILDLKSWPRQSVLSGSDTTFNEMLAIAERIVGAKFDVIYDTEDNIKTGDVTLLTDEPVPGVPVEVSKAMMAEAERAIISGAYLLPLENRLNEVFPEIRPMTIGEMLSESWSK
ncbi:hypothetical protein ACHAPJ_009308 [Fusarium lateritium]